MDRFFWVTAQPGAARTTIDFRQATHYLRDEPGNPPGRATTIEFRQADNSNGGDSTNHGSPSRITKDTANFNAAAAAARLSSYSSSLR
jgi:hypothetical protein